MVAKKLGARWRTNPWRTLHLDDAHNEQVEVSVEGEYVFLRPLGSSYISLSYAQWEALKAMILPADGKQ